MVVFMAILTSLFFILCCFSDAKFMGVVGIIYNVSILSDLSHYTGFVGLFWYIVMLIVIEFITAAFAMHAG
jgi:hypothetical protein